MRDRILQAARHWRRQRLSRTAGDSPPTEDWSEIEKSLGDHRIVGELGRGGTAVVYQVVDVNGGVFALKVPFETELEIQREWENTRVLRSPHIVRCHECYLSKKEGQRSYLKLECLEGETLEARLSDRGRLDMSEIHTLVEQVLKGLQVAHDRGVIHCDLKPANLFLCKGKRRRETLKITDFGLSRTLDPVASENSGSPMGTAAYAAPEQMEGARFDGRVDLYAVGVLLFEMATGLLPWHALDNTAVLRQKLRGPAKAPQDYRPDFPDSWNALVLALLRPNSEERPDNVGILRDLWRSNG